MVIYVNPTPKIKKVICKDCGKEFEQKATARFARKYCDKCSAKRKKDYENLWKVTADECEDA
ncbi:hypothetical protein H8D91_01095 [archaeon]|nr:hypothetical protein [archaeon]